MQVSSFYALNRYDIQWVNEVHNQNELNLPIGIVSIKNYYCIKLLMLLKAIFTIKSCRYYKFKCLSIVLIKSNDFEEII